MSPLSRQGIVLGPPSPAVVSESGHAGKSERDIGTAVFVGSSMLSRPASLPVLLSALAGLFCACTGPYVSEPSPEELQDSLDGQQIEINEWRRALESSSVSDFNVVEIYHNHASTTSVAVVTFIYATAGEVYRVDGIISYERTSLERMLNPRFETNEANRE